MRADSEQTSQAGYASSGQEGASYSSSEYEVGRLKLPDLMFLALHANIGRLVARKYRLKQLLGSGGMGAVYRAVHEVTGAQVAVKMPLPLRPYSDDIEARFVREARAGARIGRHRNVADVYDIERDAGVRDQPGIYLIMELLHGTSLADRLGTLTRSQQLLSPAELLAIMVPVLRGVAAAHARGIVHRDLKPGNIFLCRAADGGRREPKVLDFGICKFLNQADERRTSTAPGCLLGTSLYMPHEQRDDASCVDERADIYALGVTMYEALTGGEPVDGEDECTALARRVAKLARPRALRIPAALEAVVLRAMEKRAAHRHPSAEALLEDLLRCQRDRWRGTRARASALGFAAGMVCGLSAMAFAGDATLRDTQPLALPAMHVAAETTPVPDIRMALEVSEPAPQQAPQTPVVEARDGLGPAQAACAPARSAARGSSRARTADARSLASPPPDSAAPQSPKQPVAEPDAQAAPSATQVAVSSASVPLMRPITIARGVIVRR